MDTDDPRRIASRIVNQVLIEAAQRDDAVGDAARAELRRRTRSAIAVWKRLVEYIKSSATLFAGALKQATSTLGVTEPELDEFEKAARNIGQRSTLGTPE